MKAERRPIEVSQETRTLLAKADVPAAFVEHFRDLATAIESPTEPMPWEEGESFLAAPPAPDEAQDAPLAEPGTKPFYLTQTSLNLSFLQHVTRGLWDFECCPFPGLIFNTVRSGSFFADALLACCAPPETVCVRVFVIDVCGASKSPGINNKGQPEQWDNAPGLLKGVRYKKAPDYRKNNEVPKAPHLGRLTKDEVDNIEAAVKAASGIWETQCVQTAPGKPGDEGAAPDKIPMVKFETATNPNDSGQRFVYALDLEALPPLKSRETIPVYMPLSGRTIYYPATVTTEYDLCGLLEGEPKRNLTAEDGQKDVDGKRSIKWADFSAEEKKKLGATPGATPPPPPKEPIQAIRDAMAKAQEDGDQVNEKVFGNFLGKFENNGEFDGKFDLLALFGHAVDSRHKEFCINVFVFGNYTDTGDVAGYAHTPGRNVFLDEDAITGGTSRVLAHEFGHNLGLGADNHKGEPVENLMHGSSEGTDLREEQCVAAAEQAKAIPKYP